MSAIGKNGQIINIKDSVSVIGQVVSVSGLGQTASVTVQSPLDSGTYVIQANDCNAVQHNDGTSPNISNLDSPSSVHPAVSISGKVYGAANDSLTVMGRVTAISGSGVNAVLTVQLVTSQNSINTAAGNCNSDNV